MSSSVQVRGGRTLDLNRCESCDFEFFAHDPSTGLAADALDAARLTSAGLAVPELADDFANGKAQSVPYLDAYLGNGGNVLEIGCSWGYLLDLARERGAQTYGIELNRVRCEYVERELGIPCDGSLDDCEARGVRFRTIFMLWVLEYIPQPVDYLRRVVDLLEDGGSLVVVTPNLHDPLLEIWRSEAFRVFFHDEFSVSYFSVRALERLLTQVGAAASVRTIEGYSIVSHLSWFLTNAPRTTGVVGGDRLVDEIAARVGGDVAKLVADVDARYRTLLEEQSLGNQLHAVVTR
ncbi:MAG TPA: class I SAM-dependent methyltransferase [Gaiellaceae bacterium]|nr:class I SAM-dependent methyltransferase [Gaiellaceae bacterium]